MLDTGRDGTPRFAGWSEPARAATRESLPAGRQKRI